jgi:hypothetical protein
LICTFIGAAGHSVRRAAAAGAIGRHARDLLTDRLHDGLDPPVAGVDRRPQPDQVLVHRSAQIQNPLHELFAQRPVLHMQARGLGRTLGHALLEQTRKPVLLVDLLQARRRQPLGKLGVLLGHDRDQFVDQPDQ